MSEKNSVQQEMDGILQVGLEALQQVEDETSLQQWRIAHLGKAAPVMQIFTRIGQYVPEDRPKVGQSANLVKKALEDAYEIRQVNIKNNSLVQSLSQDHLDVTLPGRIPSQGRYHVQTQTMREIYRIFAEMGFQIYRARDVETDEYSFELLNIPEHHPARDMWDTYYTTKPGVILRTHTSPGQIHVMRERAPEPIRVILPGMCYRYEQMDARHEIQFTQIEVLAVGTNITFGDLKGTLDNFSRRMFGENVRTRLRPSYFPFTEPSGELDIECFVCAGKGCSVCKGSGWLEILGCGMVHPTVLQNGGYDPREFSGFAAGMGPERISLLRHKIDDIRYFWGNDVRFLEQF